MRRAAIVIAKYVRRYLAYAVFRDMQEVSIREFEIRYTASIHVQRVFRAYKARDKLRREREERERAFTILNHAAIRVQRQYYRRNGEFSAFCLMCGLRARHGWDRAEHSLHGRERSRVVFSKLGQLSAHPARLYIRCLADVEQLLCRAMTVELLAKIKRQRAGHCG